MIGNLSFNRLMECGTFYLDATTSASLTTPEQMNTMVNKAVTITGNGEVGFGTTGKPVLGIVSKCEYEDNSKSKMVVTVNWDGTFEEIVATGVAAGDFVTVDGNGGLAKSTDTTNTLIVAAETDTATIIML